ncbi:hypothetical protein HYH03_008973 [Edaphochlamys debaryana]|uniref:Uncharacterized protein n=1 Tax=Edaphochlamys debaryana TaxID=47281 RepID=A0A835Y5E7_9CHLO|nr:hypothetical protein HYH03_008973 [Edaphochlamys debaryana]|eukprot:KAG2492815.1 hypothetical protein HYH03_008973 [Edaphochlamys debaryana]
MPLAADRARAAVPPQVASAGAFEATRHTTAGPPYTCTMTPRRPGEPTSQRPADVCAWLQAAAASGGVARRPEAAHPPAAG